MHSIYVLPCEEKNVLEENTKKELHVINTAQTELRSVGMDGGQALKNGAQE